jgi:hypothetical protein
MVSINVNEFLKVKFENFLKWVATVIGAEHKFYKEMKLRSEHPEAFHNYLTMLDKWAGTDNNIEPSMLTFFLGANGLDLTVKQKEKLGKYLRCFVTVYRNGI